MRRIPSDLQTFYRTDCVILSLRTKSLHRASRASERLSSRLDDYWLDLRLKQTEVPGSHLFKDHSLQKHGITVTLGSTLSHACDVYKRIKGKGRGNTSGKGKGRKGNPKDRDGKTMECDICGSTQRFRRECPKGDGKGRGAPSAHLAQTDDDIQYVDFETYLADTCTPVYFMTMKYMDAGRPHRLR